MNNPFEGKKLSECFQMALDDLQSLDQSKYCFDLDNWHVPIPNPESPVSCSVCVAGATLARRFDGVSLKSWITNGKHLQAFDIDPCVWDVLVAIDLVRGGHLFDGFSQLASSEQLDAVLLTLPSLQDEFSEDVDYYFEQRFVWPNATLEEGSDIEFLKEYDPDADMEKGVFGWKAAEKLLPCYKSALHVVKKKEKEIEGLAS